MLKADKHKEHVEDKPRKSSLRENIEAILIAVVIALFIRTFVVQAFKIPSGSMKNTLLIGDHILVSKFIYGIKLPYLRNIVMSLKSPQRGDIIVFKYPEDPHKDFIKRVIGVPGDSVEYRNKQLFINNERLENDVGIYTDPHVFPGNIKRRDNFGPIKVPENKLFVMGDNRDESYDSRFWGFVDMNAVSGKAFMIYWSWNKDAFGVRWKRLGNVLH